jgi:hypothetical protein
MSSCLLPETSTSYRSHVDTAAFLSLQTSITGQSWSQGVSRWLDVNLKIGLLACSIRRGQRHVGLFSDRVVHLGCWYIPKCVYVVCDEW